MGVLEGHTLGVLTLTPLSTRQGNSILASGSRDKSIRVWDVESLACLAVLNGHISAVRSVSFVEGLPDDSVQLVSGSLDDTVAVWDVTDALAADDVSCDVLMFLSCLTDFFSFFLFLPTFSPFLCFFLLLWRVCLSDFVIPPRFHLLCSSTTMFLAVNLVHVASHISHPLRPMPVPLF